MLKKVISTLYVMVVVAMAVATVVEKTRGTEYVIGALYG